MTTRVRALQWIVLAAVAASTVACGSSMTATGPSGLSSSGAVISGRVNVTGNAAAAVARFPLAVTVWPSAAPLANANGSLTVSIVGTGVSTTIDGSGSFTITDVPAGTVQLRFQGRGADAILTISGIEEDDHLQIAVTLNGHSARLDSRHRTSKRNGVEVNGRIDAIDGGARTLRVDGQMVLVQQATFIRHGNRTLAFADLRIGDHIQVKGMRDGASVFASEIKVEPGDRDDDDDGELHGILSGLSGSCPSLTFFVSSVRVMTNASTRFEDGGCSTLDNGLRVDVKGSLTTNGTLIATRVERD